MHAENDHATDSKTREFRWLNTQRRIDKWKKNNISLLLPLMVPSWNYHIPFEKALLSLWFFVSQGWDMLRSLEGITSFSSWWLNQPHLKNMLVNMGSSSPNIQIGVNMKNIWNHHLDLDV